jgi:hypothetical protein
VQDDQVFDDEDALIPLEEGCKLLGGISEATYRRRAHEGIYPPLLHPSPNITRVSRRHVIETRRRIIEEGK